MISKDAQVVHAVYDSMYRFMIERDIVRLASLLDDSFVLVHMTGRRQSKEEFLTSVRTGELRYYSGTEESYSVHVEGTNAMVLGRSIVEASPFGMARSFWRLEQEISMIKRDGRWLIAKSVVSMY